MGVISKLKYSLVFCLFLIAVAAIGQGSGRRIHTVKQGETIYGICQQYGIKEAALLKFNPEVKEDGLKVGDLLLIPDAKSLELQAQKAAEVASDTDKFHYHKVKPGETLYGLAKRYEVTMADIEKANILALKEGLKEGISIRIPRKTYLERKRTRIKERELDAISKSETNFDKDWFYHKVGSNQTAYSLSKQYKISLDSLYLLNPSAEYGLRIGQWLKFPLNRKKMIPASKEEAFSQTEPEVKEEEQMPTKEAEPKEDIQEKEKEDKGPVVAGSKGNSKFFLYKVKEGDTFYSLSQRYRVTEAELIELNKELKNGLVQGRYIIMPKKEESKELNWLEKILKEEDKEGTEEVTPKPRPVEVSRDSSEKKPRAIPMDSLALDSSKEFAIAVVLPFRASLYADTVDYRNFNPHRDSEMSMQFYLGLLNAADSLEAQGMKIRLRVYDTEAKGDRIKAIARDIQENKIDLIFGPAYKSNVDLLSSEISDIPMVSPLSNSVSVEEKPNLIQMVPSEEARNLRIAYLINTYYPHSKLIFAHCGSEDEQRQAQSIKAHLDPRATDFIDKIVNCDELQNSRSLSIGNPDTVPKVIVLLSNKPVFATDLISKLYNLKDTNVVLVGSPRLMDMQTMELRYLDALHYTTYEIRDPQYQDSLTRILVEDFRAKYKSDAGPFALQGFDAGLYFLSKLWGYGPYLLDHLDAEQGISTGFDFKPVENGGQENQFLFLTQLKDFKMQRLKH